MHLFKSQLLTTSEMTQLLHRSYFLKERNFVMLKLKDEKTIQDALRNLVRFVQFKNVKNIHGGVLLLAKLH